MNSSLQTAIHQVLTGLNSTVASIGLNALPSPVICTTAPNGLQIPKENLVIQITNITIFPKVGVWEHESDKNASVAADTKANSSLKAPLSNDNELKPLLEKSIPAGIDASRSDASAILTESEQVQAPATSDGPELEKEANVSIADKGYDLKSTERMGQTQPKRLKQAKAAEIYSLQEVSEQVSDTVDGYGETALLLLNKKSKREVPAFLRALGLDSVCTVEHSYQRNCSPKLQYKCEKCGKSYAQRSLYNDHMHSHEGAHSK